MLQGEHSAILSTCIKLPSVFKTFVLSGCLRPVLLYILLTIQQLMNTFFQTIFLLLASNNGIQMSRFKHHTKINLIVYMKREILDGLTHLHHLIMSFILSLKKMGLVARKPVFEGLGTTQAQTRLRSLISTSVILSMESKIYRHATSEISIF